MIFHIERDYERTETAWSNTLKIIKHMIVFINMWLDLFVFNRKKNHLFRNNIFLLCIESIQTKENQKFSVIIHRKKPTNQMRKAQKWTLIHTYIKTLMNIQSRILFCFVYVVNLCMHVWILEFQLKESQLIVHRIENLPSNVTNPSLSASISANAFSIVALSLLFFAWYARNSSMVI